MTETERNIVDLPEFRGAKVPLESSGDPATPRPKQKALQEEPFN